MECPICLEIMTQSVITSCHHQFHSTCYDQAITYNPTCPLCRQPTYLLPVHRGLMALALTLAVAGIGVSSMMMVAIFQLIQWELDRQG